ncbi:MAG: murein L,D-transpeptidase catalytic domain family protein [Proteobacteria bacterium]|nr:murein L,D-transpeptidase catalytic domain family protein [Pseudomonadota bacterium]
MKQILTIILIAIFIPFKIAYSASYTDHIEKISKNTQLSEKVVRLALRGYQYAAAHSQVKKKILTIVDYTKPSIMKRMYVIDLETDRLLMNVWVAHGHNTGNLTSIHFSNRAESKESSVGVFVTEGTYYGHEGKSMVIKGLEKNVNDNAKMRHLVVHAAPYVSSTFAHATGRMGRSYGCLAVNSHDLAQLIALTQGGSVIFSYAPEEDHDRYLAQS